MHKQTMESLYASSLLVDEVNTEKLSQIKVNSTANMHSQRKINNQIDKSQIIKRDENSQGKGSPIRSSVGSMNKYLRHNIGSHTINQSNHGIEPIRKNKPNNSGGVSSPGFKAKEMQVSDLKSGQNRSTEQSNEEQNIQTLLSKKRFQHLG